MNKTIECPIDRVTIDENRARVGAFFVLLLVASYLLTLHWFFPALLLFDFVLRATGQNIFSPIYILSGWAAKLLKIKIKPIDRGPKRFAAAIGAVFSALILSAHLVGVDTLSLLLAAVLIVFASLESFIGFCAGCYVYSFLKPIFTR